MWGYDCDYLLSEKRNETDTSTCGDDNKRPTKKRIPLSWKPSRISSLTLKGLDSDETDEDIIMSTPESSKTSVFVCRTHCQKFRI